MRLISTYNTIFTNLRMLFDVDYIELYIILPSPIEYVEMVLKAYGKCK